MKRNTSLLLGWQLAALLCLVGCSADEWTSASTDNLVQISASIESPISTRMQVGEKGNEAFQQGDQLSLFVTSSQSSGTLTRTLNLSSAGWTPALTWQEINSRQATFSAFYPSLPHASSQPFVHAVALDQRSRESLSASDLLFATVEAEKGMPVELSFQHRLSFIELHLTTRHTFTAEELAQATVHVRACPSVEVHPVSGELSPVDGQTPDAAIAFHHVQGSTYCVVLPPQPIRNAWRQGWIEIVLGGETFTYKAPLQLNGGEEFTELMPGQQLTLTLTLDKNQQVDDWVNKTVWTYGLKEVPSADQWGYAFVVPKEGKNHCTTGLKWTAGCGWYDCNKTNPQTNSGGDSEMCWAAAASNMIHWWLDQNKSYIERFDYQGPKIYENAANSAIFLHFKKGFYNEGQQVYHALNWFFTGCPVESGTKEEVAHGFFQSVLGEKKQIASFVSTADMDAASFSKLLKQAFQNQEAIECNILYKSGYLHAINIWGAAFDAKGEVSHIYITDNNDKDLDNQPEIKPYLDRFQTQAGILEKAVRYKEGGVFMESSNPGDFSFHIIQVCTLGLKTSEWEAYFNK